MQLTIMKVMNSITEFTRRDFATAPCYEFIIKFRQMLTKLSLICEICDFTELFSN